MSYWPSPDEHEGVLDPMASQIHGSRCVRNRTSIHPRLVFTKRAILVVAMRPRPLESTRDPTLKLFPPSSAAASPSHTYYSTAHKP
ncbi:hypothetical protein F2Q69_00008023 [Brassica cretica]|uniref:Uncharacterized protein n=1 Tax=Brassica cretica TaxID=69181 RepID=A0A8S9NYK9_BRACR|nr:hypothetical protein F2Q69_00008023 [Brassica cretica]